MVRVAVIGAGYWGPNLIRNFFACPGASMVAVCDRDQRQLKRIQELHPSVETVSSFDKIIARSDIDAVAIATPINTHSSFTLSALRAGKHVLVEKPMTLSVREAEAMVEASEAAGRILMVDHTFVYSDPVRKMKDILDSGALGDIYFIDSVRINLGLFQHTANVVWDLAPHDLSIMDYLLGRLPESVCAFAASHVDSRREIEDVAYLNLDFGGGFLASFHVNWLSPVKVRHFIIGGSRKSIVYNDLDQAEKIRVYDSGILVADTPEELRPVLISYRTGDIWAPHMNLSEPLNVMVRHFVDCIERGTTPITDGAAGLRVVRILEAAQESIKERGRRVTL